MGRPHRGYNYFYYPWILALGLATVHGEMTYNMKDNNDPMVVFAETTDAATIHRLVRAECALDTRALCEAERAAHVSSPCGSSHAGVASLLIEHFSSLNECTMVLEMKDDDKSSFAFQSDHMLEILLRYLLEEIYVQSRVYFLLDLQFASASRLEEVQQFIRVQLASVHQLLSRNDALTIVWTTPSETTTMRLDNSMGATHFQAVVAKVVEEYSFDPQRHPAVDHDILIPNSVLEDMSLTEYHTFFDGQYLNQFRAVLANMPQESPPRLDLPNPLTPSVVGNSLWNDCLWDHWSTQSLITESCAQALPRGRQRLVELTSAAASSNETYNNSTHAFAEWYFGASLLFLVLACGYARWRITVKSTNDQVMVKLGSSSTQEIQQQTPLEQNVLTNLRRWIAVHLVVTIALWMIPPTAVLNSNNGNGSGSYYFVGAIFASVAVYVGSLVAASRASREEEEHPPSSKHGYELPLVPLSHKHAEEEEGSQGSEEVSEDDPLAAC